MNHKPVAGSSNECISPVFITKRKETSREQKAIGASIIAVSHNKEELCPSLKEGMRLQL
jgi:hypothetical protein